MTSNYAAVNNYQDVGSASIVKNIDVYKGKSWEEVLLIQDFQKTTKISFKSYFQRPERIRFEWIDNQSKITRPSVVWSDGKNAYSWRTDYDDNDDIFIWDKESSLKWAINEETRGSMSVADILYNALTGSNEYYSFNKMTRSRIAHEEVLTGRACYVILGEISNDPWALWIDKKSFVLRRYRMQIATGSFDESVRTGYMPTTLGEVNFDSVQTNSTISRSIFDFRPKLRKGDIDISKYADEKLTAPMPPLPQKPLNFDEQ
ncbi:MAG: hypothetical protein WKF34_08895 [Pyrinomonadaceae bacterium]